MTAPLAFPLIFFDVDSTLASIEGIDVLAAGNPEIARLTEAAMNGEIGIDAVYERRLEIIRPSRSSVERLAERYVQSLVPGARELVGELVRLGGDVHLITAGIEQAVVPLAASLGIAKRAVHAVQLEFEDGGEYRSFDRSTPLTRPRGKELVIRDLRARAKGKAALIGDGVTDAEAKDVVDLFIGFGGVTIRERVRAVADVFVTGPSLSEVLPHLLKYP